ncbi:FUSC family protein, partial [Streptomyces achromogenes]
PRLEGHRRRHGVAELEQLLGRVRLSVAPLVHPLNPMPARKARARRVLALLDDCAREVRGLVAVAADPEASHDARLAAACWRVETAVEALTAGRAEPLPHPAEPPAEPALVHLHGLERALADLAEPLRTPSRSRLVGA